MRSRAPTSAPPSWASMCPCRFPGPHPDESPQPTRPNACRWSTRGRKPGRACQRRCTGTDMARNALFPWLELRWCGAPAPSPEREACAGGAGAGPGSGPAEASSFLPIFLGGFEGKEHAPAQVKAKRNTISDEFRARLKTRYGLGIGTSTPHKLFDKRGACPRRGDQPAGSRLRALNLPTWCAPCGCSSPLCPPSSPAQSS